MFHRFTIASSLALAFVALLVDPASAQEVLRALTGETPGEAFGPVAPSGDLDGDGIGDLIVGAPLAAPAGAAQVVSGASGAVLLDLTGVVPSGRFGATVAGVGDANGDGIDDLVVGAPGQPGAGLPGTATLFSGADGAVLWTQTGPDGDSRFGAAIAGAGDLDGDGLADVLVGAPGSDVNGLDAGQVFALSGASGTLLFAESGEPGDEYGSSMSGDPPGFSQDDADVVIGATMGSNGGAGYVQIRSKSDFSLVAQIGGLSAGDRFGSTVALLGDIDADGVSELAVGTDPVDALGASTAPGVASVHSGTDGALLWKLAGDSAGTGFASLLGAAGDVDGDGTPDVAIAEPGSNAQAVGGGALHVLSGVDGSPLHLVEGSADGLGLASHIAYAGDLDGDTLADLAVSAPGASSAGDVFVFSFSPWDDVSNGVAGTYDVPQLSGRGGVHGGSPVVLELTQALESSAAALVIGGSLAFDPVHGVLGPTADIVVPLATDLQGESSYADIWPEGQPSGSAVYYQFRVNDGGATLGQSLSNTLAATMP